MVVYETDNNYCGNHSYNFHSCNDNSSLWKVRNLRTDELNRAVSASIKKTVSDSQIENQSTILSDKEMVAYFIQLLSVNMKGKGDVTVEVYDADYKEGLLSVAVTEKFKYVNGKNGEITVRSQQ